MYIECVASFPNLLKQCVTSVMSVLSLASCKPLYSNLTQLNFETGTKWNQNVAVYRVTKRQNKTGHLWKSKEHQKKCWILLDVGLGQIHACFLPECILVTVEPLKSSCKNETRSGDIPSIEWTCWKRMVFDFSVIVKRVLWSSQNYRCIRTII